MKLYLYFLSVVVIVFSLTGCNHKNKINNAKDITNVEDVKTEAKAIGIIKEINQANTTIMVYDVQNKLELLLSYTGGTDIKDNYDAVISSSQLQVGEIVDVIYYQENNKIKSLQISKDAWEYNKVGNLKVDESKSIMQIGEKKYRYSQNLMILSNDKFISLIDLNEKDVLTVKGIGDEIYSVIVTAGHGYIKLQNYNDFIGGIISVGYDIFLPISEDMLIVAREGNYKITMENGELNGTKMINVLRDQEITVDMSEYHIQAQRVGNVTFDITPDGADLYINGTLTDYSKKVELNYGEHTVEVKLSGYESYTGKLTIAQASQTIHINLAVPSSSGVTDSTDTTNGTDTTGEAITITPIPSTTATTVPTTAAESNTTESNSTQIKEDTAHKIYIQAPTGVDVYLNGTKKGTTPLEFTKQIGNYTITLAKSGYETKSFTVAVLDDSQNVYFSFPDMTKED